MTTLTKISTTINLPQCKVDINHFDEIIEYSKAMKIMDDAVSNVKTGSNGQILILQHLPVYTLGTSATDSDIIAKHNITTYKSGRGGKITYHAPGQIVCYLILDLKKLYINKTPDIKHYVSTLEDIIIDVLTHFNISGFTKQGKVGVWVDDKGEHKKIAAIGVRISGGVAFHGFCINVDIDMSGYNNIIPCGISDYGVCSLKTLKINSSYNEVKILVEKSVCKLLHKKYT